MNEIKVLSEMKKEWPLLMVGDCFYEIDGTDIKKHQIIGIENMPGESIRFYYNPPNGSKRCIHYQKDRTIKRKKHYRNEWDNVTNKFFLTEMAAKRQANKNINERIQKNGIKLIRPVNIYGT